MHFSVGNIMSKKVITKNINTKQEQFEALVTIMEANESFAQGYIKGLDGKKKSNALWEKIEQELNILGPPTRDVEGWKKVWAGYKDHIKNKMKRNRLNMSATGGGPSKILSFSPTEQKVIDLLQYQKCFSGMTTCRKFGTVEDNNNDPANNQSMDELVASDVIETSSQEGVPLLTRDESGIDIPLDRRGTSTSTRQTKKQWHQAERGKLLQQQVNSQGDFHKNVVEKLDRIRRPLKDICYLIEKTNRLLQSHFQNMELIEKERNQLILQKLELKKKIVDIQEKSVPFAKSSESSESSN